MTYRFISNNPHDAITQFVPFHPTGDCTIAPSIRRFRSQCIMKERPSFNLMKWGVLHNALTPKTGSRGI